MIISHSRRFVFIHIHKTAGESITKALAPHLSAKDTVLGGTPRGVLSNAYYTRRFAMSKHSGALRTRRFLGEETWDAYFTFSVVRNPYDRALSLYHYYARMIARRQAGGVAGLVSRLPGFEMRDPLKWPGTAAYLETASFSEFIRHPAFDTSQIAARPQASLLSDRTGKLLVDFVGRFETLAEDFRVVAGRIGLPQAELGWHNASRDAAARSAALAPADRDRLYELYRADFDAFGYDRAA